MVDLKKPPNDISILFKPHLKQLHDWYIEAMSHNAQAIHDIHHTIAWYKHIMYTEVGLMEVLAWSLEMVVCDCIIELLTGKSDANPFITWFPHSIRCSIYSIVEQYDWVTPQYDVLASLRNLDWKQ